MATTGDTETSVESEASGRVSSANSNAFPASVGNSRMRRESITCPSEGEFVSSSGVVAVTSTVSGLWPNGS